jgi:hypothetical protein
MHRPESAPISYRIPLVWNDYPSRQEGPYYSGGFRPLPGNEKIPTGLKALSAIPKEQLLINIAVAGALDALIYQDKGKGEYPGDLRNGLFKWSAILEEQMQNRAIELEYGRAAQMGIPEGDIV